MALLALSTAFVVGAAFLLRGALLRTSPGSRWRRPRTWSTPCSISRSVSLAPSSSRGSPEICSGGNSVSVPLFFEAANLFAGAYSAYGTFTHSCSLPAPVLMSLLSDMLFVPCLVLAATFVPLLFPTGRPPTRRWWIVGALAGTSIALATTALAIRPGPVDEDVPSAGRTRSGFPAPASVADTLELAGLVSFFVAALGSFVSVAVRSRRSRGEEQRQLSNLPGRRRRRLCRVLRAR